MRIIGMFGMFFGSLEFIFCIIAAFFIYTESESYVGYLIAAVVALWGIVSFVLGILEFAKEKLGNDKEVNHSEIRANS